MKKNLLKSICVLIFILLLGSSVTVLAGTTYSGWNPTLVNGQLYDSRSVCLERYLSGGNTLEAVVEIKTSNNVNVPAGYMGGQAYLCDENDNVVTNSPKVYNSFLSSVHYVYSPSISSSGNYYAFGLVRFYNQYGDYTENYTYCTPMASITSTGSQTEMISNESSDLEKVKGKKPQLNEFIPVKKQDGTRGFVRRDDISPEAHTLEEALEITKRAEHDQIIPMYNAEGEVIGEWVTPAMKAEELGVIIKELDGLK